MACAPQPRPPSAAAQAEPQRLAFGPGGTADVANLDRGLVIAPDEQLVAIGTDLEILVSLVGRGTGIDRRIGISDMTELAGGARDEPILVGARLSDQQLDYSILVLLVGRRQADGETLPAEDVARQSNVGRHPNARAAPQKLLLEIGRQPREISGEQGAHLQLLEILLAVAEDVVIEGARAAAAAGARLIERQILALLRTVLDRRVLRLIEMLDGGEIAAMLDAERDERAAAIGVVIRRLELGADEARIDGRKARLRAQLEGI